jgi:hypothetical protein
VEVDIGAPDGLAESDLDRMPMDQVRQVESSASQENTMQGVSQRPKTRLQSGIRKEKIYTDDTVKYGCFTSSGEPATVAKALDDENWGKAMRVEYEALVKNRTQKLVPPQKGTPTLLDANGCIKLSESQMGALTDIKLI